MVSLVSSVCLCSLCSITQPTFCGLSSRSTLKEGTSSFVRGLKGTFGFVRGLEGTFGFLRDRELKWTFGFLRGLTFSQHAASVLAATDIITVGDMPQT